MIVQLGDGLRGALLAGARFLETAPRLSASGSFLLPPRPPEQAMSVGAVAAPRSQWKADRVQVTAVLEALGQGACRRDITRRSPRTDSHRARHRHVEINRTGGGRSPIAGGPQGKPDRVASDRDRSSKNMLFLDYVVGFMSKNVRFAVALRRLFLRKGVAKATIKTFNFITMGYLNADKKQGLYELRKSSH